MMQSRTKIAINRGTLAAAVLLALLAAPLAAPAQQIPDKPRDYVVDLAGVVDRGIANSLNGYLQELERKTSVQMLVLTVDSTAGVPIEDFSLRVAEKWKLGQAKQDNGVLFVVAIKDRAYRIDAGYGVEHVLTDQFCGRVGREVLVPHFRKGNYGLGALDATLTLATRVANAKGVKITGMPARPLRSRSGSWLRGLVPLIIIAVFVLSSIARRRQYGRHGGYYGGGGILPWLFIFGSMGGGRSYGGGSFGGGFGGGGFGGSFGGGGGGGFGGGGASGSW